mgnify:CR=1 FL=1
MRKVNEYVEQLKAKMKDDVRQKLKDDEDAYKALMKDLLIQVSTDKQIHLNLMSLYSLLLGPY